jgi:hypothetical protein
MARNSSLTQIGTSTPGVAQSPDHAIPTRRAELLSELTQSVNRQRKMQQSSPATAPQPDALFVIRRDWQGMATTTRPTALVGHFSNEQSSTNSGEDGMVFLLGPHLQFIPQRQNDRHDGQLCVGN